MGSLSPFAVALLIVCAIAFIGAFLAFFRDRRTYAGHEEYSDDARSLAKRLNGELFRDGEDLVVSGNLGRLPATLRFSYAENTPAMNIRVEAPASFAMSIVPKGTRATEGRVLVRTPDDMFDARFVTRSDHPTQAKLFLSGRAVMEVLQKLCCSSKSFVTIANGAIEVSELAMPAPYTLRHINDHLDQIEALGAQLARMPGADRFQVKPQRRERRLVLRLAIVAGIIAALAGVIAASKSPAEVPLSEIAGNVDPLPMGVRPVDAPYIRDVKNWRLAVGVDVNPDTRAWMRSFGVQTFGRIGLNFNIDQKGSDSAYLLLDKDGQRRVVVIAAEQSVYDVKYPGVVTIVRVPKSSFANVPWNGRSAGDPDGDGVLIVRNVDNAPSAMLIYFSSSRLVLAALKDYQAIQLID